MDTKLTRFFKFLTFALVMISFGPEILVALELVSLIELIGAAAFWSSIWIGIKMQVVYSVFTPMHHFLRRFDPDFFIPCRKTVKEYPAMLIHAVPTLFLVCFFSGIAIAGNILKNISFYS